MDDKLLRLITLRHEGAKAEREHIISSNGELCLGDMLLAGFFRHFWIRIMKDPQMERFCDALAALGLDEFIRATNAINMYFLWTMDRVIEVPLLELPSAETDNLVKNVGCTWGVSPDVFWEHVKHFDKHNAMDGGSWLGLVRLLSVWLGNDTLGLQTTTSLGDHFREAGKDAHAELQRIIGGDGHI